MSSIVIIETRLSDCTCFSGKPIPLNLKPGDYFTIPLPHKHNIDSKSILTICRYNLVSPLTAWPRQALEQN